MNENKFRGKIAEKNLTIKICADFLGISRQTLSAKISGKSKFYNDEVIRLANFLDLTNDETNDIFFTS